MKAAAILAGCTLIPFATSPLNLAQPADPNAPRYGYLYRDTQISLALDTSRVMFVQKSDVPELIPSERAINQWSQSKRSLPAILEVVRDRVVRVSPDDAARMWSLEVAATSRSPEQIESLVSSLVSEEQTLYAGPAFVDPEGRPLLLSGYYLVSFVDGTSEETAREMIRTVEGGTLLEYNWASTPCLARVEPVRPSGFEILRAVARSAKIREVRYAEPGLVVHGQR